MRARPTDGMTSTQAMEEEFVWSERRQIGRWRAFWRVVGYLRRAPSRIGATMTDKRDLRGAMCFSFVCLISQSLNWILFFLIGFLLPIYTKSIRPFNMASGQILITALSAFAFFVGLVLALQLLFLVWGLITHGLIRMTGRSRRPLGHTLSATQYCAGTFILCAIPVCGTYLSLISIVWMAVAMVSALAALHKISRWRTVFAVLVPPVVMISVSVWFVYSTVVGFWNIYNSRTPMNFPPMPTNSQPIVAPNTPINTPSSAPTDATEAETEVETDPVATSQPIDAPTKNPDPVITDPTPAPTSTQDPAPPNPPKKTSSDSAAILIITHGI